MDAPRRPPITLLLVDDHEVVLEGLRAMLAAVPDRLQVVGATTDPDTALRLSADHTPDVVLLDVRLRSTSGLDLCQALLRRSPSSRVVFFTVYDDDQYLFQALRLGAAGFLLKRTTAVELAAHLERVREGEVVVDPSLAGRVALTASRLDRGEFWPGAHLGLTQRESEVLDLAVRGLANRAIAQRLIIGEETVKTHLRSVYRKLEVDDRAGAVAAALRQGIFH
ncbi:MAG: response regulator [Acidimicrobiales bacterium]